jgi:transposase
MKNKNQLTKKEFENLYKTMTIKALALTLGVSRTLIYSYVDRLGINRKGRGGGQKIKIID